MFLNLIRSNLRSICVYLSGYSLLVAMPVDRGAIIQLGLLLLAIPAQYLIGNYMETTESQRSFALKSVLSSAVGLKNRYFTWSSWHKWCLSIFKYIQEETVEFGGQDDPNGESPAVEVIKNRSPDGMFGGSLEPRTPHPKTVKFRVGQVIKHKIWGYRGVIVAWDPHAKAPASWLEKMHLPSKPHWRTIPNYTILVDVRDRIEPQVTYVPEENIEVIVHSKIIHPSIDEYFDSWDGAQYIPRPWLKAIYPHD